VQIGEQEGLGRWLLLPSSALPVTKTALISPNTLGSSNLSTQRPVGLVVHIKNAEADRRRLRRPLLPQAWNVLASRKPARARDRRHRRSATSLSCRKRGQKASWTCPGNQRQIRQRYRAGALHELAMSRSETRYWYGRRVRIARNREPGRETVDIGLQILRSSRITLALPFETVEILPDGAQGILSRLQLLLERRPFSLVNWATAKTAAGSERSSRHQSWRSKTPSMVSSCACLFGARDLILEGGGRTCLDAISLVPRTGWP